jgi:hypothetical protein
MRKPEIADHRVEGAVLKRERLRIRPPELDSRMLGGGTGGHRLGHVDTRDRRAPTGCLCRHVSGAGRHIQHARARTYPGEIEERLDQPPSNPPEEPRIPLNSFLPRARLEFIEGGEIDVDLIARHLPIRSRPPLRRYNGRPQGATERHRGVAAPMREKRSP